MIISFKDLEVYKEADNLVVELSENNTVQIKNKDKETKISFDSFGNATFTGTVDSSSVITDTASVSGTLYASQIESKSLDEIQALLTEVEADQKLLKDAASWNTSTATESVQPNNLVMNQIFITGQAVINSISLSQTLSVGTDLVIQSQDSSINTLSTPLKLQSLAATPIEIMAGLVRIETNGDVKITGNVAIAGNLTVGGKIETSNITLKADPESKFGQILEISNNQGVIMASVNASGSAVFSSVQTKTITGSDEDRGNIEILPAEDTKAVQRSWTSAPAAVLITPSYNTKSWVKDVTQNGFTINVEASPTEGIGKLYWWAIW